MANVPSLASTPTTSNLLLTLIFGLFALQPAWSCTIASGWTQLGSGTTGTPRYQGECAYIAASGDVLEHDMGSVDTYTVAFYALTKFNSGSTASNEVTVFRALDGSDITQLELVVQGNAEATLNVNGGSPITGNINAPSANYNGWNHYKVVWDGNDVELFINGNQASGSSALSNATVSLSKHQIGYVGGSNPDLSLPLAFDNFISLQTDDGSLTEPLMAGDANDSGMVDINDVLSIVDEVFISPPTPATGQPDCNGNGSVDINDVLCIVDIIF